MSFTFSNPDSIQSKLKSFSGKDVSAHFNEIFGSINEVGEIELVEGKAIILKSIDPTLTKESLAQYISSNGDFREIELNSFSSPELFIEAFYPLISDIVHKRCFNLTTSLFLPRIPKLVNE